VKGRRLQFGLATLMWTVTAAAVLCSIAKTCPEAFRRITGLAAGIVAAAYALVVTVDAFLWIKRPAPDGDTNTHKIRELLQSPCVWVAFGVSLLFILALNVIPYYLSRGAYRTDGDEVIGWPLYFWIGGGGIVYTERINAVTVVVDLLAVLILPIATGVSFRNGAGAFFRRTRILLRKSLRKARTWPHE
jgi:hypothetical protein